MARLVINADDLGKDALTNRSILAAFKEGIVSSATVMANMPGFEEASEMVHQNGLIQAIGIHLNFSEGVPLVERLRRDSYWCDENGLFRRRGPQLWMPLSQKSLLAEEAVAQIRRCRAAGLRLSHADSHRHVHAGLGAYLALAPHLRREGISALRRPMSLRRDPRKSRSLYAAAMHHLMERDGFRGAQRFGDLPGFLREAENGRRRSQSDLVEIMVHVSMNREGELVEDTVQEPLLPLMRRILRENALVSYANR